MSMLEQPQIEPRLLHQFKNYLAVVVGFCDMLLTTLPEGDTRSDIVEIRKAADAANALLPELARHYRD
jgi:hypothetical protein